MTLRLRVCWTLSLSMKSASDNRTAEVDLTLEFPTYVTNNKTAIPPNVADEGKHDSSPAIEAQGTWSADC